MLEFLTDVIAGELDVHVITITLLTVMVVLLFLSFPMVVPLAIGALIGLWHFSGIDSQVLIQQMVTGISPNALIAVPMFILAADIMTRGHTAHNLLGLIQAFVGHMRGGLPITTSISCTLFGSVSGSTQATVVSVGQIMRPRLLQAGYKDSFAMALIINASDIAFLIPPSIGLILYGTLANTSVGELFISGIGPGILLAALFFTLLLCAQCASRRQHCPGAQVDQRGEDPGVEKSDPAARVSGADRRRHLFRHRHAHRGGLIFGAVCDSGRMRDLP